MKHEEHKWDGIEELHNDPPRWWMIGGYITIIFLIVYFVLYPSIPYSAERGGYTKGLLGYTQMDEFKAGLDAVIKVRSQWDQQIESQSLQAILADPTLVNYVRESAKFSFGEFCAPCHNKAGEGQGEFPNLVNDDWIYGGTVENIHTTIAGGRAGAMTPNQGILSNEEIDALVRYVTMLPEGKVDEEGQKVFMGETEGAAACVACHGADAKGNKDLGGVNLTDSIWRFSSDPAQVRQIIEYGINSGMPGAKAPNMPAFGERLGDNEVKKLAVYVWSLGGGVKSDMAVPSSN